MFPKFHSSAFGRISSAQIENLAQLLRDVLQRLDKALSGPPYNLTLQDRLFLRPYNSRHPRPEASQSRVPEAAIGAPLSATALGFRRRAPMNRERALQVAFVLTASSGGTGL